MKIKDLIQEWEQDASAPMTAHQYNLRLPVYDAAKIAALAEIYPGRSEEQILTDLLSVALNELVEALPYVKGEAVVDYDEEGDPIYEDTGITPRLHDLAQAHLERLTQEAETKK